MKFSGPILAASLAVSTPTITSGFSAAGFFRDVSKASISRGSNGLKLIPHSITAPKFLNHEITFAQCACIYCSRSFALSMSDTVVEETSAEVDTIPSEVNALDGIASDEEGHNIERPARGSGIHKHNREGERKKRTALADLEIGSTVEATVKTITTYGAFLDIGARSDALIHVSCLADDYVANVKDVLNQGDTVSVRIVSVDTDKNQIAVTMRSEEGEARAAEIQSAGRPTKRRERPQRSGADQASQAASITALSEKGFDESKFIDGEVVSTLDFGAFVRFDSAQLGEGLVGEIDGLVHISALAEGRTVKVSDVVSVGDKIQVRVRTVEPEVGRISLSMITKEQEEASRPAPRERRGGGNEGGRGGQREVAPIANSWKDTGAADWKETLLEFSKDQPLFANTALVMDKRK